MVISGCEEDPYKTKEGPGWFGKCPPVEAQDGMASALPGYYWYVINNDVILSQYSNGTQRSRFLPGYLKNR